LVLDDYGSETTWEIRRLGDVVYSGGPYEDDQDGLVITVPLCLEEGCYILQVDDSYGDGMCCDFGEGSFTVFDPDGDIIYTGGEFTDSDLEQFCTQEMSVGVADATPFAMWPNPATASLTLDQVPAGAQVEAFDALGRQLFSTTVMDSPRAVLDVSAWPRGWVMVRVLSGQMAYTRHCILR
jgi:hypothetical protein